MPGLREGGVIVGGAGAGIKTGDCGIGAGERDGAPGDVLGADCSDTEVVEGVCNLTITNTTITAAINQSTIGHRARTEGVVDGVASVMAPGGCTPVPARVGCSLLLDACRVSGCWTDGLPVEDLANKKVCRAAKASLISRSLSSALFRSRASEYRPGSDTCTASL